jgi:hypothetical protein
MTWNRQRSYATLVGLGICILLFRAILMLTDGSLAIHMLWVTALLCLECTFDGATVAASVWWWIGGTET